MYLSSLVIVEWFFLALGHGGFLFKADQEMEIKFWLHPHFKWRLLLDGASIWLGWGTRNIVKQIINFQWITIKGWAYTFWEKSRNL